MLTFGFRLSTITDQFQSAENQVKRTSGRLKLSLLVATIIAVSFGCSEKSAPSTQQADGGQESITANSRASADAAPIDSSPQKLMDQAVDSNADAAAPTGNPATAPKQFPSAPPVPKPTPEQIAKWTPTKWDNLQLLSCRDASDLGIVKSLAALSDGLHFLLVGSKLTLWSIDSAAPEHIFFESTDDNIIESVAVSPDEKWFAAGDREGTLRVWSLTDRTELQAKKLYSTGIIQTAVSPDSQTIATMTYGEEVSIWNAEDLSPKQTFSVDTNGAERIEFMTSNLLVVAGETTSLWNVETGKLDKNISPGRYNFTLARSPDGSRFLFGQEDALHLRDVEDQKAEIVLNGGFAQEELAAFSSGGNLLATANHSVIRIWDVATGKSVQYIDAFGWPVTGLAWLPESDLLLVSSITGRTRIWGTVTKGEASGLKAMHVPIADPKPASRIPATPSQLMQTIDLRVFPRLPDGEVTVLDQFNLMYEAPVSAEEAQLFYRYVLDQTGWKELATDPPSPDALRFQKDDIGLTLSSYAGADHKTMLNLNVVGNYDLRWLPKADDNSIDVIFENADTVIYRTKLSMTDVEVTLLRKMHDAGWTAYSRMNSSHSEDADRRDLEFLLNGLTVQVSIGRFPGDPSSLNVQYSRTLTVRSIPVPLDCGFVEFDGSTEPLLVASTSLSLNQTCEFYDKELAADGWLPRDHGRSIKEDHASLPYIRGQQDLTLRLRPLETGRTQILVGDELQNSSWQLEKLTETTDDAASGIEAADFPILNEAKSAKYDANGKSIEISMNSTQLPEVAERYVQEMKSIGWDTEGAGIRSDDYVFLTFIKDKAEVELRARMTDGMAIVNIQGDGLLWTKPLPTGKKVVAFETWLRANHHPASLDRLDEYQKEMNSILQSPQAAAEKE